MKRYLLIYLLLPIFFYSQNSPDYIITEKIKQIESLQPTSKDSEQNMISLSKDLYYISKKAGNKKGMIVALLNLSNIYITKGEVNECLKLTTEGITLAEELKKHKTHATFLNIKAIALLEAGNYADSRINFSKALKIAELIEDPDYKHLVKSDVYARLVNYADEEADQIGKTAYKDSILYFAKKSYDEVLKISEKKISTKNYGVGQAARILGQVYIERSDYKEGEKYLDISEKLLLNGKDTRLLAALYSAKGDLKFKEGDNERAIEYYEKALELSTHFHYNDLTGNIYENLIKYYKKTKDAKKELYYTEISKNLNDSLSKIQKDALITQHREDMQIMKSKQESEYVIWFIWSAVAAVILACLFLFYFRVKNKAEKLSSTTDVSTTPTPQKAYIDPDKIALLLEMAKSNDKQFLILFQEVFADLHKELLKFPELTSADLEMCAYLKLNIQTKEIATYKKVSIGAVDNRKYRIRKKLNLLPETDLYKWINTINN